MTTELELSPNKSLRLPVRRPTPSPPPVLSPQSLKVIWWGSSGRTEREGCCNACNPPDLRRILLDKQNGKFLFHQIAAIGG